MIILVSLIFITAYHPTNEEIIVYDERQKEIEFCKKYVKLSWEKFLYNECKKFNEWDYKKAYIVFRATSERESENHDFAKEWKHGRIISRGRFQISHATHDLYCRHKGLRWRSWVHDSHDKFICTEIFVWTMRLYWKDHHDFRKCLSSHNLGPTGFDEWIKRNRYRYDYYFWYIDKVRQKLPKEYKELL